MMSLSKASKRNRDVIQAEDIWPKFSAESPESSSFPRKEEDPDFVSFEKEKQEDAGFRPLETGGEEYAARKAAEDVLQDAREKSIIMEKEAYEKGKTIREIAHEQNILPEEELKSVLDPGRMTAKEQMK